MKFEKIEKTIRKLFCKIILKFFWISSFYVVCATNCRQKLNCNRRIINYEVPSLAQTQTNATSRSLSCAFDDINHNCVVWKIWICLDCFQRELRKIFWFLCWFSHRNFVCINFIFFIKFARKLSYKFHYVYSIYLLTSTFSSNHSFGWHQRAASSTSNDYICVLTSLHKR